MKETNGNRYKELGRFIMNFETLMFSIKFKINDLVASLTELSNKPISGIVMDILLAELDAKSLVNKFRSLLGELQKTYRDPCSISYNNKIQLCIKLCIDFYEIRNNLVHRTYRISVVPDSMDEKDCFSKISYNNSARSSGLDLRSLEISAEKLADINKYIEDLIKLVNGISIYGNDGKILTSSFFRNYSEEKMKNIKVELKKYKNK